MRKVSTFSLVLIFLLAILPINITAIASENDNSIYYKETDSQKDEIYSKKRELKNIEIENLVNSLDDKNIDLEKVCYANEIEYKTSETYNLNGEILDSHVMTNQEVFYNNTPISYLSTNAEIQKNTNIGSDKTQNTKGTLIIRLIVYKSGSDYVANGIAEWTTKSKVGGENYPDAAGNDFVSITWGGSGKLVATNDRSISGVYYNKSKISFSKAKSDSYAGYCWQFKEKTSGLGSNAHTINCLQTIAKTYPNKNYKKKTNIKFTYLHTYQSVSGSISFISDSDKLKADNITLSKVDKQWQVQVDVPGVSY